MNTMVQTLAVAACVAAVALGPPALAANAKGQIRYVDPSARTIEFQDGRIVRVEPGMTFWVDGRQVSLAEMRSGLIVEMRSATPSGTATGMAQHPPIDSSGVVKSYDPASRRVTFQDGRTIQLGEQSQIWQAPSSPGWAGLALPPGTRILVENAQPVSFQRGAAATYDGRYYVMGTVLRTDPSRALVVLDDGRLIKITQGTKMGDGMRDLRLSELRHGDQVVIWRPAATPGGAPMTAPPTKEQLQGELAAFTADEILVIRRPQAS